MTTEASRPQPSPNAPRSEQPAARKRSPIERVIVWGLILALVVVAGLEFRARLGYDRTREALEAKNLGGPLSTLEDAIHFAPARRPTTIRHQPVLELKWFSLVHDYRIALIIDSVESDDPVVRSFQTAGEAHGLLALEGTPEPEEPSAPTGGMMPGPPTQSASAGGPAGGHGGPGGGHGGSPRGAPADDAAAGDSDAGDGDDPGADAGAADNSDAPLPSQP